MRSFSIRSTSSLPTSPRTMSPSSNLIYFSIVSKRVRASASFSSMVVSSVENMNSKLSANCVMLVLMMLSTSPFVAYSCAISVRMVSLVCWISEVSVAFVSSIAAAVSPA